MNRRTAKARDARKAHAALVRRQLRRRRERLALEIVHKRMAEYFDKATLSLLGFVESAFSARLSFEEFSRALHSCRCRCDLTPSPFRVLGPPLGIIVDPIP